MTAALKEWAAVVHALLDGRQTVLLRKGRIGEKRFAVESGEFLLFPTVAHSHAMRTFRASGTDGLQPRRQVGMRGIDAQADDMHRLPAPADGNFHPGNETHSSRVGGGPGLGQAGNVVMVGQGENVDAIGRRTCHHLARGQNTVGNTGMAMQIDIEHQTAARRESAW